MNTHAVLIELLLGGFFAIACLRAIVPHSSSEQLRLNNLFNLPGRVERLRRSRWQWFSMVALLLVIRLQQGVPLIFEFTVVLQFLIFLAIPAKADVPVREVSQ